MLDARAELGLIDHRMWVVVCWEGILYSKDEPVRNNYSTYSMEYTCM